MSINLEHIANIFNVFICAIEIAIPDKGYRMTSLCKIRYKVFKENVIFVKMSSGGKTWRIGHVTHFCLADGILHRQITS